MILQNNHNGDKCFLKFTSWDNLIHYYLGNNSLFGSLSISSISSIVGNSCTLMKVWSISAWACGTCEAEICEWVHWLVGSKYGDIRWSSFAVTSTYWKIIFRKNIRLHYFVVIFLFPRTVSVGYFSFRIYWLITYVIQQWQSMIKLLYPWMTLKTFNYLLLHHHLG